MRIGLIYLGRHGPGGPISFELASHLSKKAELFCVVSQNSDHIRDWRESGFEVIEIPTFDTRWQAIASSLNTGRLRKLARRISDLHPDVLLFPMVHPWTPALQKYLRHIPAVTTVHDPAAHPGLSHRMSSFWEKRSARLAARCVVLGHTFVENMQSAGVSRDHIDVIPHAVFSFYDRFAPDTAMERTPPTLLFFGRITEYKGLEILLRAFQLLQARRPELRLRIVGEGNIQPYRELIAKVRHVEVINRWVEDAEVPRILQSASIVVVPYTSASQSGVIAVAANFARPVIATRVGAIPEQIRDGETGILVQPNSPEALASAIDRLLDDDRLRERLGQGLAAEMRTNLSWETTSDAYLESCRKACGGRS